MREMQDADHGVPVRSQKLFLTSIPAAFMGKLCNNAGSLPTSYFEPFFYEDTSSYFVWPRQQVVLLVALYEFNITFKAYLLQPSRPIEVILGLINQHKLLQHTAAPKCS